MAASLKSDAELKEWFRERLIWDDPAVVLGLLRNGLFSRIYTPQVRCARDYALVSTFLMVGHCVLNCHLLLLDLLWASLLQLVLFVLQG